MTEHDLSFIENYAKIRRRLYYTGRPDVDRLGHKVVSRRHASDFAHRRAAMEAEAQAKIEAELKRVAQANRPNWRTILNKIARDHSISTDSIIGHSRKIKVVRARQEAIYWVWYNTSLSFPQVGDLFNRDHATVIYSIRAHAWRNNLPVTRGGER